MLGKKPLYQLYGEDKNSKTEKVLEKRLDPITIENPFLTPKPQNDKQEWPRTWRRCTDLDVSFNTNNHGPVARLVCETSSKSRCI